MIALLRALFGGRGGQLAPHEAAVRLRAGAVLVDVREAAEFARGHAPGARLLPLSRILAFLRFKARHRAIFNPGADQRTYQRRRIPRRGPDAALAGHPRVRCVNVAGGMQAWVDAGLPMTTPRG